FTVRLNSQPIANVTVGVNSSDPTEGKVSPALLTFTPDDWNGLHTVTVTGVNDDVQDEDQSFTIVLASTISEDQDYAGKTLEKIDLINGDDDIAGVFISSVSGEMSENGDSASFTIKLQSEPAADVTFTLSSSDETEGTLLTDTFTFTPSDWDVEQTVIITGEDDDADDGDQKITLLFTPTFSGDSNYNGLNFPPVPLTNKDNDEQTSTGGNPGEPTTAKNQPPTAEAGSAQHINENTIVTLDGSQSVDSDGQIVSYDWKQIYGPVVSLSNASNVNPTFIAPEVSGLGKILTFQLTVTDDQAATAIAYVSIEVFDVVTTVVGTSTISAPPDSVITENASGSITAEITVKDKEGKGTQISSTVNTNGSVANQVVTVNSSGNTVATEVNASAGASTNITQTGLTITQAVPVSQNDGSSTEIVSTIQTNGTTKNESQVKASSGETLKTEVTAPQGAKTQMNQDGSVVTQAPPVTQSNGSVTQVSSNVGANGSTKNTTEILTSSGHTTMTEIAAPAGSQTKVSEDGSVVTATTINTQKSGVNAEVKAKVSLNGNTSNEIKIVNNAGESTTSKIEAPAGTTTSIEKTGTVTTKAPPIASEDGKVTEVVSILASGTISNATQVTNISGKTVTTQVQTPIGAETSIGENGTMTLTSRNVKSNDGIQHQTQSKVAADGTVSNAVIARSDLGAEVVTEIKAPAGSETTITETGSTKTETPSTTTPNGNTVKTKTTTHTDGIVEIKMDFIPTGSLKPQILLLPKAKEGAKVEIKYNENGSGTLTVSIPLNSLFGNYRQNQSTARNTVSPKPYFVGRTPDTAEPVYVIPLSEDVKLQVEKDFDSVNTTVYLAAGSAVTEIGGQRKPFNGPVIVNNIAPHVSLEPGTNLIALPVKTSLSPADLEVQFQNIRSLWIWNKESWTFYSPDASLSTFYKNRGISSITAPITSGQGLWIETDTSEEVSIGDEGDYDLFNQLPTLSSGWHLLGTPTDLTNLALVNAINQGIAGKESEQKIAGFLGDGPQIPPFSKAVLINLGLILFLIGILLKLLSKQILGGLSPQRLSPVTIPRFVVLGGVLLLMLTSCNPQLDEEVPATSNDSAIVQGPVTTTESSAEAMSGTAEGSSDPGTAEGSSATGTTPETKKPNRVHSIWKRSNGKWQAYSLDQNIALKLKNAGYNTFSQVNAGEGFWVNIEDHLQEREYPVETPPAVLK
ncbi:hypothetical protein WDW89_15315, partial [Deltaproteobacteria bacterium TL4]